MFDPAEPFLLGSRDQAAITHKRRRGVAMKSVQS
jgi:hypothetical protein